MINKHYNVPWNVVRDVIHLGYDYSHGDPQQFDFISQISHDDLQDLVSYASLQKYHEDVYPHGPSDWDEILRLLFIELEYRDTLT